MKYFTDVIKFDMHRDVIVCLFSSIRSYQTWSPQLSDENFLHGMVLTLHTLTPYSKSYKINNCTC